MKERGYLCQITERWNSFAKVRQDLFGFIDVLCVGEEGQIVGVQTTSYSNMSARIKKIREHENFSRVSSGMVILVQGWHKKGSRWQVREVEVVPQGELVDVDTP